MRINKRFLSFTIIAVAVVNILFFVIPIKRSIILYAADIFIVISAAIMLISFALAFRRSQNGDAARSRFLGWPIMRLGIMGFVVSVIINVALVVASQLFSMELWVVIVLNTIMLAVICIGLIGVDGSRNFVERQKERRSYQMMAMKEMRSQSKQLVDMCRDLQLQKRLKHMADAFCYSDPNSNSDSAAIEETIKLELEKLGELIDVDNGQAFAQADKIEGLLKKRNSIVLITK